MRGRTIVSSSTYARWAAVNLLASSFREGGGGGGKCVPPKKKLFLMCFGCYVRCQSGGEHTTSTTREQQSHSHIVLAAAGPEVETYTSYTPPQRHSR